MMEVLLFIGPDDAENVAAAEALDHTGAEVCVVKDTKVLEGRVVLPFAELPDGGRCYGLASIQRYAATFGA